MNKGSAVFGVNNKTMQKVLPNFFILGAAKKELALEANRQSFEIPPLSQPVAKMLKAKFKNDNERLGTLIGQGVSHWNTD